MHVKYKIPWSLRSHRYTLNEINLVKNFLKSDKPLINGEYLNKFEKNFSSYLKTNGKSFAVSSGTCAIEIIAALLNLKKDDEIIIPAHTYCASALPFARYDSKIIWADINPDNFTVDAKDIKKKINKKTKAVIVTHLYGMPCEINEIMKICKKNKVFFIEDCAQALGAKYYKKKVGTFGDFAIFSLHAQKNMSTLGAGGVIVVNNKKYIARANGLRKNGHRSFIYQKNYWLPAMVDVYEDIEGITPYNFPFTEIQSLLGIQLLKRLDKLNNLRIKRANDFIDSLKEFKYLKFQKRQNNFKNVYHLLPAYLNKSEAGFDRDSLIKILSKKFKIKAIIQFYPLYRYHFFKKRKLSSINLKNTDEFYDNMISFPFHHWMSNKDFKYLKSSTIKALEYLENI